MNHPVDKPEGGTPEKRLPLEVPSEIRKNWLSIMDHGVQSCLLLKASLLLGSPFLGSPLAPTTIPCHEEPHQKNPQKPPS